MQEVKLHCFELHSIKSHGLSGGSICGSGYPIPTERCPPD